MTAPGEEPPVPHQQLPDTGSSLQQEEERTPKPQALPAPIGGRDG